MSDMSTNIQVWFLRHGATPFDYENSAYDDFIQMLCNGHNMPLQEEHGIDFISLPERVEFVGCSPTKRAVQTAEKLCERLGVKLVEKMEILNEVKFDCDIIGREEYTSGEGLVGSREPILERWWKGKNRAESFNDSLARVRAIETFLCERQEDTIILVTHGWFLRLLEVYFVQGKHTDIELKDILDVKPVSLGHSLKATVKRKSSVNQPMDLVEDHAPVIHR